MIITPILSFPITHPQQFPSLSSYSIIHYSPSHYYTNLPPLQSLSIIQTPHMVFLPFTNIAVDEFSQCKKSPNVKYIHFMSHMHSDHHVGMSNGWNYGKLYCSEVTANLLAEKFHGVTEVVGQWVIQVPLALNKKFIIQVGEKLNINVTLLDANHCPGAVMFLFEGYFGVYLYTGDIRFHRQIFESYTQLYPEHLANSDFVKASKRIDIVFLDNTFCDPVFTFPSREQVLVEIEGLVEECRKEGKRVLIAIDNLGKEEILTHLAYKFSTYIVVSNQKYYSLLNCGIDNRMFTTKQEQGWIEVIGKREMKHKLGLSENSVGIIPTGWCNRKFQSMGGRIHMFPYSLHSNFQELETFMNSLDVARVVPIVRNFQSTKKLSDDYGQVVQEESIYRLSQLSQRGFPYLEQKYTTKQHTPLYQELFRDPEYYKEIAKCFTKQQKLLPENFGRSLAFSKATNIEILTKKNQQLQSQKIPNPRTRASNAINPPTNPPKKEETDFDQLRDDLIKKVQQQREQLRKKGIEMRPKQYYQNKYQVEKERKLISGRAKEKRRSMSRESEESLRAERKTVVVGKGGSRSKREREKTRKEFRKQAIETIEISEDQESRDRECRSGKEFPLKRVERSWEQEEIVRNQVIVGKEERGEDSESGGYLSSQTLERYIKQAILRDKSKKEALRRKEQPPQNKEYYQGDREEQEREMARMNQYKNKVHYTIDQ